MTQRMRGSTTSYARSSRRGTCPQKWWGPGGFAAEPPSTYQPAYKPGSVRPAVLGRRDGHSSGTPVTRRVKQPTRMTGPDGPTARAATSFLFGLAPGGVCRAASVAGRAVRSYRTVSPLPAKWQAVCFSVALSLGSPPPDVIRHRSSMEPGLSSPHRLSALARDGRPAD